MVKVAVAGGSGQVAREIIDALLAARKHEIVILSRSDTTLHSIASEIRWQKVDYENQRSLVDTLRGTHTLLSFIQTLSDPDQMSQKNLIDAAIAAGVKRFVPSEYGSKGIIHMPWWCGKEVIREYLEKVNEKESVFEYTLFQPGLFLDYLAYPFKTSKYLEPLQTFLDLANRRIMVVDDQEYAAVTFTTVSDLAAVVARAIDYDGKWPVTGGIRGNRLTFSQIIDIGRKIRGFIDVTTLKVEDLEAGDLNSSWSLQAVHHAVPDDQAQALLKQVAIGFLLSSSKGAWDVSDDFNQIFPDFEFASLENFLTRTWEASTHLSKNLVFTMGVFSSRRPPPETIPGDRIIPLSFWDDQDYARGMSLDITLTFNDVLDPEKLRDALHTLLQKKGWEKFGARLRKNQSLTIKQKGKYLEYHIPEKFTEKRPAFLYSTDKHDMTLSEHPQMSAFAFGNLEKPTLLGPFDTLRPYLRGARTPERLDDWLFSDAPQLAVHVVVFKDVTFVTITFIHLLMDAMGFTALLKGWTAILRGREDQVPPIMDAGEDPLATIHQMTASSKYVLADRVLKGWAFIVFVIQYIFELVWWRKDEERLIYVPGEHLKGLRDTALAELSTNPSQAASPAFVSESDVLLAWWTRIFIKALNPSPSKPITILNVFDIRGVLTEMGLLPSADTALIANVTWPTVILVTAGEILSKPISFLASRIRHAIDTHRTVEQVQAIAATQREAKEKTGQPAVYGDIGAFLFACSNWHRGKLFQMDFSSAVVKENPSQSERANLVGRPLLIFVTGKFVGFSPRNSLAVMGKDAAGNWWLKNVLRTSLWSAIEEQL